MGLLAQLFVNGVAAGSVYGLLALGFSLIYGVTGILHLSHGAVFSSAGYTVWFLMQRGWPLAGAALASALVAAWLGLSNYYIIYRPLRRRKAGNLGFFIGSIAFAALLENSLAIATQNAPRYLSAGTTTPVFHLGLAFVTGLQVLSVASLAVFGGGYVALLRCTDLGLNIRAVASNPEMARVVGINVERIYQFTFCLGSALAVPAAIIVAYTIGLTPYFGTIFVMNAIAATILGGIGSFVAPMGGALMLGAFENLALWKLQAQWQLSLAFALVLVLMLVRPQGIWGTPPRERSLRQ